MATWQIEDTVDRRGRPGKPRIVGSGFTPTTNGGQRQYNINMTNHIQEPVTDEKLQQIVDAIDQTIGHALPYNEFVHPSLWRRARTAGAFNEGLPTGVQWARFIDESAVNPDLVNQLGPMLNPNDNPKGNPVFLAFCEPKVGPFTIQHFGAASIESNPRQNFIHAKEAYVNRR